MRIDSVHALSLNYPMVFLLNCESLQDTFTFFRLIQAVEIPIEFDRDYFEIGIE